MSIYHAQAKEWSVADCIRRLASALQRHRRLEKQVSSSNNLVHQCIARQNLSKLQQEIDACECRIVELDKLSRPKRTLSLS